MKRSPRSRRALTLLEFILSLGLIIMVSSAMFAFYWQALQTREVGREAVTSGYLARAIAYKIAEEIKAANNFLGPGIIGDERMIAIQTVRMPSRSLFRELELTDEPLPAECDIRQVRYYLAYDEEKSHSYKGDDGGTVEGDAPLGLVRMEIKTPNQLPILEDQVASVDVDLLAPEIKFIYFRYFDGFRWVRDWDVGLQEEGASGNTLPQAIEITVGYKELPPPLEEEQEESVEDSELIPPSPEPYSTESFTVMVRLNQADALNISAGMRNRQKARQSEEETGL